MAVFTGNLVHSWRLLVKRPGATALAVLTLALGIGLTGTMFSVVNGVVLRGLPFDRSDRLMHVECNNLSHDDLSLEVSHPDFLELEHQQESFEGLAGFYTGTVNVSDGQGFPERFDGAFLSHDAFELLRIRPVLGRTFRAGEDSHHQPPVLILGYGVWRSRYGGDPGVIGKAIHINGESGTIVGVMPQGFAFPVQEEVWLPLRLDPEENRRGEGMTLEVYGRLRDRVTLTQARAEIDGIVRGLAQEYPETNAGQGGVVKPFAEEYVPKDVSRLLFTMLGAVSLVLLIACANVASLLLARATARTKELAVRSALGASRLRMTAQLLTESLLLAGLGATLGLVLASLGARAFAQAVSHMDHPFWFDVGLDGHVVLFVIAVTLAAGLLAGLAPAMRVSRTDLNDVLKDESRGASGIRLGRFARLVVVAEIALSCALLVGAGLLIRSVVKLDTTDLGFRADGVLTARIGLFDSAYPDEGDRRRFYDQLVGELSTRSGVVSAALTSNLPTSGFDGASYALEGEQYETLADYPRSGLAAVTPAFRELFGLTLLQGRWLETRDRFDAPPVAVVNRSFAQSVWPGEDPLGKRLQLVGEDEPWRTVIGVVADAWITHITSDAEHRGGIYLPLPQTDRSFMSVAVRTRGNPMDFVSQLREVVLAVDPDLPIYWVRSMQEVVDRGAFYYRLFAVLFSIFGAAALLLASVGIYGVVAFAVGHRTREFGLRMALGARRQDVLGLVLRQGAVRLTVGLAIGLGLAFGVSRLLSDILFEVSASDPVTFGGIALILGLVSLLACLVPAVRATRVDPIIALRYE